jgi:Protein of unknown function (DUF4230)
MAKVVGLLFAGCVIGLLAAVIVYLRLFAPGAAYGTLDSKAVVKEVRQLNELVTVRYSIEKVVGMKEQKSPVGSESILLLVQGKVLAGVDLAGLTASDVTMHGHGNAVIRLVQPHIEEAFLDEKYTKVWDRSITWWTPWVSPDVDLEHKARMQAIDDIKETALQMGILGEARRNAETSIRTLLQAFGIEKTVFAYSS